MQMFISVCECAPVLYHAVQNSLRCGDSPHPPHHPATSRAGDGARQGWKSLAGTGLDAAHGHSSGPLLQLWKTGETKVQRGKSLPKVVVCGL